MTHKTMYSILCLVLAIVLMNDGPAIAQCCGYGQRSLADQPQSSEEATLPNEASNMTSAPRQTESAAADNDICIPGSTRAKQAHYGKESAPPTSD